MIGLTLQVVFSLAVVLFLMWGLAKVARRPLAGRAGGKLAVLARQQLTRGSSVAVVKVADRTLVLGITEQHVTLLAETDEAALAEPVPAHRAGSEVREPIPLAELTAPAPAPAPAPTQAPTRRHAVPGRFSGSALSLDTWRQAAAAGRLAIAALRKGMRA